MAALKNMAHSAFAPARHVATLENRIDCPSRSQLILIFRLEIASKAVCNIKKSFFEVR